MGGAERQIMDYFNYIDYNNYSVIWAVKQNNFSEYLTNLPVKITEMPNTDNEGILKKFFKFYRFFKSSKPDCIIFSQFWLRSFSLPEILAGYLIAKGNIFMVIHDCALPYEQYKSRKHFCFLPGFGFEWRRERLFQKMLVFLIKKTIPVSKKVKEYLINFHKYPHDKIRLAYHGIDTNKFSPSLNKRLRLRSNLDIPAGSVIILSTSRLDKIKRLDRLIEVFSIIAKQKSNIYLVFAGAGSELDNLQSQVNTLGNNIKERIRFLGFQKDISGLLQGSDIFALSSDSEGLSLSLLEAMSCGLICIATECGGVPEVIDNNKNGFLVEVSSQGLIQGLRKALDLTEEEKKRISNNARKTMEKKFNLQNNVYYVLRLIGINHKKYA